MILRSYAATGCTGGLGVRIIFAADLSANLGAMLGARIVVAALGRAALPTGRRADFADFFNSAPALLAPFLSGRRVALDDRPAVLAEWLLIGSI
jgi:hypothetical protein